MPKRSWTDEDLRKAIATETTWRGVQVRLGLRPSSPGFIRGHADRVGADYSHFAQQYARRWTDEDLREAVAASESVSQVIRKLGLAVSGSAFDVVLSHAHRLELDTSHFSGQAWVGRRRDRKHPRQKHTLETIFCKDSLFKDRLLPVILREGYRERRCESCGLAEWLGAPIPIEVDHINGFSNDNRLENLRLLCPNCHALTPTWRGRNRASWLRASSS